LPSKLAYPNILAEMLNINEVVNNGESGSSNIRILKSILSFKFKKDDIAILQWTFSERDTIFSSKHSQTWLEVGNWVDEEYIKHFYSLHTEYDLNLRSTMLIQFADLFLRKKNVTLVHLCPDNDNLTEFLKTNALPWFEVYLEPIEVCNPIDIALDNSHPGIKSHTGYAKQIKRILDERKNTINSGV